MTEEALREVVATLGQIAPQQLHAGTPLGGPLAGSLGRARLAAILRSRHNITDPAVYRAVSFGELCAAVGLGTGSALRNVQVPSTTLQTTVAQPTVSSGVPQVGSGIRVGIDLETISALPPAIDLWEEPFYAETFTPGEIAYAQLRPNPRASLAAMWCAKEALRKSDAVFVSLNWTQMEVVHDASGKPVMRVNGQALDGALSLSHTDELSCAVYVNVPLAIVTVGETLAIPHMPAAPPVLMSGSRRASMVSWLALLLAVVALVLSLLHRV